jgi:hypothetical protein
MDGRQDRYLREQEQDIIERRQLKIAAHRAQGPFIRSLCEWDCTMTGTYDPSKLPGGSEKVLGVWVRPRVSRWKAMRDAERLWEFACRLTGTDVPAVFCAEPHLDRSYHLHGVMALSEPLTAYLGGLTWWWLERHGFCHFDVVRKNIGVSDYLGKHLTGPDADVWFSPGLK